MPQLPEPRTDGPYRIALVCLGNICRSPMAHVVLAAAVDDAGLADRVELASSGTGDWHVGRPMDRRAAAVLTTAGYDASRHRARQFDATWLDDHDLVLAMDASNLADVRGFETVAAQPPQPTNGTVAAQPPQPPSAAQPPQPPSAALPPQPPSAALPPQPANGTVAALPPRPTNDARVRLFRDFDPVDPGGEVPDPYYGGDSGFEEVLEMVERTAAAIVAYLRTLLQQERAQP